MANRIKGITIEIGGETTKLEKALRGVNSKISDTQAQLKQVDKLLKLDPTNTELLKEKQELLGRQIKNTEERLQTLRTAFNQAKEGGEELSEVQMTELELSIKDCEQQLNNLKKEQDKLSPSFTKNLDQMSTKLKGFGDKVSKVGEAMTKTFTVAFAGLATASIKAFNDVDAGLDIITAKTGATGEAMESMGEIMGEIATEIPTDFETAGEAIGEVNSIFGVTGKELKALSKQFIQFAELNNTDVSSSVDSVQKAMASFGLESKDTGAFLDTLNSVGQNTGIDMNTLANSLVSNGSALKELGMSASDAATFLGTLETSGVDASTVMTGLSKAQKMAMESGTSLFDTLSIALENSDQAIDIFGAKAGPKLATAFNDGTLSLEMFRSGTTNLNDSLGSVSETYDATIDSTDRFKTAMNELELAGSDVGRVMGESVIPIINELSVKLKAFSDWWSTLNPKVQETIIKVGAFVAALGPVLMVIGKVISAIGTFIGYISSAITWITSAIASAGGLSAALAAIAAPAAAVAAVIAAVILWIKNWNDIVQLAKWAWADACDAVKAGAEKVSKAFEIAKTKIQSAFEAVRSTAQQVWQNVQNNAQNGLNTLRNGVQNAMNAVQFLWTNSWNSVLTSLNTTITGVKNKASAFYDAITSALDSGLQYIKNLGTNAYDWGADMIDGFVDGIKGAASKVTGAVSNVANKVTSYLHFSRPDVGPLREYESWMPDMMQGLADSLDASKNTLLDSVKNLSTEMAVNMTAAPVDSNASLLNYLSSVLPSIGNSQVVLDSGAVVGGLIRDIDTQLGIRQFNAGRRA